MRKSGVILLFGMLMFMSFAGKAQDKFRYQAMFVYNFTRMTAWPQDYQSGEFVIGVYGNSPIQKEFEEIAKARMVGNQKIVVQQLSSVSNIGKCHVIYVPGNNARDLAAINDKLKASNIACLVVTDTRNGLDSGASVNFVLDGERQRYEVNTGNAKTLGVTLGSEMTRLASNVK